MVYTYYMKIEFIPSNIQVEKMLEIPKPSKNYIPQWYKDIKAVNKVLLEEGGGIKQANIKSCVPFLDSLTHGYIQSTWCDIYVNNQNGKIEFLSSTGNDLPNIMMRRNTFTEIKANDYYEKDEFVWFVHWIPKVPKGWSILVVPPLNHFDLPFTTTSGIIDADDFFHMPSGNMPFYLKKSFSGLIPAGTPMYQIIPIKRENWSSEKINFDELTQTKRSANFISRFLNAYRDSFWKKKNFD
jgi:hypothetical protein